MDSKLDMAAVKRAEKTELETVFRKYASVQRGGQLYMSHEDFVCRYLQLVDSQAGSRTIKLLADMADTTKDKLISFVEFQSFESLLCSPDAIHQLAFRIFDLGNRGRISFEDFKHVLSVTTLHSALPFDFNTSFIRRYFGQDQKHQLEYYEFVQLLQSLPTEHARQGFVGRDQDKSGAIPALEFVELMKKIRGFRMSSYVQDHLLSVAGGSPAREVSYGYFKAFNQLLGNLDILERIVDSAAGGRESSRVTQAQLLREAQSYAQVTPLQISLLFNLCSLEEPSGTISPLDFSRLLPRPPQTTPIAQPVAQDMVKTASTTVSPFLQAVEPVYRFVLGGIAGATGATAVYPIDLVKTRLQNQRGSVVGEIMYRNSIDCFVKVVKNEGVFGLYRGLLPQLMGVSPEKAIKLATNDTMRDFLRSKKDGSLPLWKECIAGGCGGGAQVFFTNPLEIVKIRLQVAGEMAGGAQVRAWPVVKGLGFFGLYKGASACWLRDIPFSAIYFPAYAHMKVFTSDKNGRNGPLSLFVSGFIAGVPAAGLVTPADVIKTRLQVVARKGQQTYSGIVDCFRKILRTEGPRAFWKGAPARIFRSSPQFGVTLCTYELLQRLFNVDFGKGTPTKPGVPGSMPTDSIPFHLPDHIGGFRLAHTTFSAVESRFGLVFPKSAPNQ